LEKTRLRRSKTGQLKKEGKVNGSRGGGEEEKVAGRGGGKEGRIKKGKKRSKEVRRKEIGKTVKGKNKRVREG